MEIKYFACDFCGSKIEDTKYINNRECILKIPISRMDLTGHACSSCAEEIWHFMDDFLTKKRK